MGDVINPSEGSDYRVRIWKQLTGSGQKEWSNVYTITARIDSTQENLLIAANLLVAFEKRTHITGVEFKRMTVSSWEPDSDPYDPNKFITVPLTGTGTKVWTGDLRPLVDVYNLHFNGQSGFPGRVSWRGALLEGETTGDSGLLAYTDRAAQEAAVETNVTASGLYNLLVDGEANFVLAIKSVAHWRPVHSVSLAEPGENKLRRKRKKTTP